jgi:SAM-dependent methyltransferase
MDCPICGDAPAEPQAVTEDFQNPPSLDALLALRCVGCGCVYLSPGLRFADRGRMLPQDDALGRTNAVSHGVATRSRRRRAALRLAGPGGALDSDRVVDVRARGDLPMAEVTQPGRQYDCVILNESLEYMSDPRAQLERIRGALRPGGRAVVVLPNLASPSFALFGGRHWAGYDFPRQRAVYPLGALRRLAGQAGLTIDRVATSPDPACWLESVRRVLADWGAPSWLANRFQPHSAVAAAAFLAVERLLHWRGRGALLIVSLRDAASPPRGAGAS